MIKIEGLSKKFGSVNAVVDCSLEINKGKIYGLLGPNGSGKSTLMKMIAGLYRPTAGTMVFEDQVVDYTTKANIAYMSTESFIYEYMTIKDVAGYFGDFFGDFNEDRYWSLIERFGLESNLQVKKLSTGMRSKLKVAATLAREAALIMLDEPLNGIDLVAREQIVKAIIESATEETAVVVSSHLVDQMETIIDDVIFIKEGSLIIAGEAEEIRQEKELSIVDLYREVYQC